MNIEHIVYKVTQMSAYIVDKEHILFLVQAAMSRRIARHGFSWYFGNGRQELRDGNYDKAVEVANMLWRENIASVSARYPNESSATLPGPIDEEFVIEEKDITCFFDPVEPVQVLKSCDCYEYQSCEHEGWKTSEAKAFIDSLRGSAWRSLLGYDAAKWGAPERTATKFVRLGRIKATA